MAVFVVDASVALSWCFEDESNAWSAAILSRLTRGDRIVVPAHWSTEVSNGLLIAVRRKRLAPDKPAVFWDALAHLPIEMEPALTQVHSKQALSLAEKFGLTVYDAVYLELATRRQLPLATLDADLRNATQSAGLTLL
jgi:predicted nucleic acid-binding protein